MGLTMEIIRENLKEEVGNFKKLLASEVITNSEKNLRLEKRGAVGLIIFDEQNSKANKLSTPNMLRLFDLLCEIESTPSIKSLVIISRKPSIFVAGADIGEVEKLTTGSMSVDLLMKLQMIFTFLEKLPIPSIAAIHGACLGGGLELALSCDWRIATEDKSTKLGLPEVMLGICPGWGGTQRLPRLIGLEESLPLLLTGKTIDARKAKKIGLIDRKVPKEILEEKSIEWAEVLGKSCEKRKYTKKYSLEKIPGGKWLILNQAKKQVISKTKGNYPAPLKILDVINKTYGKNIEDGLKEEAKAFGELINTAECKNLISIFYLNESVKKDTGVNTKVSPKSIKSAAVLGAGVMGGGIAQLFAAKGVRVRMKDINNSALTQGFKTAYSLFKKELQKKKINKYEFQNYMSLIEGTTSYDGFKHADIIVEAVVEDMNIKKRVFSELMSKINPNTIVASNTSSLSITEMAKSSGNETNFIGMHFFNPVHKMPLIEIIKGEKTSDETIATVFSFSKSLGKTPIVVKDGPGFVVNRILAPYLNEAAYLLVEGVNPKHMDEVIEKFGMPMGPCTLLDEVGLDIAAKVSKILYHAFGERMKGPELLDKFIESGRFGKKNKKGIYVYEKGNKKVADTKWLQKIGCPMTSDISDDYIVKRCIYVMVNEASRCLEENLVRQVSDIDVGCIFGLGFAPFRGGLLRYADSVGIENIVKDLEHLSKNGERFKPSSYLQKLSSAHEKFYK